MRWWKPPARPCTPAMWATARSSSTTWRTWSRSAPARRATTPCRTPTDPPPRRPPLRPSGHGSLSHRFPSPSRVPAAGVCPRPGLFCPAVRRGLPGRRPRLPSAGKSCIINIIPARCRKQAAHWPIPGRTGRKNIMSAEETRPFGPQALPERGTMLIVDDDAINCAILENIFAPYYNTDTAPDGRAGLEAVLEKQDSLCAVLLDVIMPGMDGIQVLHALAERGLLAKIPVFLITAEASGSVMKEAYALGVMDVISKPVIPYVVLRRVQSVVELFRARERLSNVVELQQADLLAQAKKIIELNKGMIEALAAAIEFRSEESGEHVRRIHDITRTLLLATPLGEGLSRIEIEQIALASIMHDVGKIAVPDAILNKPGRLTAE